jgi:hypothetical protein
LETACSGDDTSTSSPNEMLSDDDRCQYFLHVDELFGVIPLKLGFAFTMAGLQDFDASHMPMNHLYPLQRRIEERGNLCSTHSATVAFTFFSFSVFV